MRGARPVAKPNAPARPDRPSRIIAEWAQSVAAALLLAGAFALVGTLERMDDPVGRAWEALWGAACGAWRWLTWGWA